MNYYCWLCMQIGSLTYIIMVQRGQTPLHIAAAKNMVPGVRVLLEFQADPMVVDKVCLSLYRSLFHYHKTVVII